MSIVLAFLFSVFAVTGIWLFRQGLASKPWLETGTVSVAADPKREPGRYGMGVFITVICGLFAIFGSAYVMRAGYADWQAAPMPPIIWGNTALLVAASLFLQAAARADRDDDTRGTATYLAAGVFAALGFVLGQLLAWQVLAAAGHGVTRNPSDSFFYLLTGLHGLHVIGGLLALGWVRRKLAAGDAGAALRLCTTYWHALLGIWIGLIALFLAIPKAFIDFCGSVFL